MLKYPKNTQLFFSMDHLGNKTYEMIIKAFETGYKYFIFSDLNENFFEIKRAIDDWFTKADREEYFFEFILKQEEIENDSTRLLINKLSQDLKTIFYLDLVVLERPSFDFAKTSRAWYELKVHKEWELVKNIGVSNFDKEQIMELWSEHNEKPCCNLIEFNIPNQRWDRVNWCLKNGINVQAYGIFNRANSFKKINEMAKSKKVKSENLIINWMLDSGISPVTNSDNENFIMENYKIQNIEFTKEEFITFWYQNKFDNKYLESYSSDNIKKIWNRK